MSRKIGWARSLERGYNQIQLWKPSGSRASARHAFYVCFTWNEIENEKIYALYGSKKFFLNDHDQDNLFAISQVTNLGSYSSSHQGTCQAAPWEAVFYKQTDQGLCRRRWSGTAGLCTREGEEGRKRKQLRWVSKRHYGARRSHCTMRPHLASRSPCQLPEPPAAHFIPQTCWFCEMTDAWMACTTKM